MSGFPRVAVGSLGNHPPAGPIVWALAGYLTQQGRQVRHFFSRACYCSLQGALTATGMSSRYVDSWLTGRDECRTLLAEAYQSADFAVFEGAFSLDVEKAHGGTLDELCRRLDLPRLIVLDAGHAVDCRIPPRPECVDGVLVDDILEDADFVRIQTCLEGAWGVPVVGGLKRNEAVRQRLASLTPGGVVPKETCDQLIRSFAEFVQPSLLEAICRRATLPVVPPRVDEALLAPPLAGNAAAAGHNRPTIAVAYDDAFCGYFADMLESMERHGAKVVDFSPLADEALPEGADIVLFGCGRPDVHAEALAANQCMMSSLRSFARRAGRIYAEGGGLAYLGRAILTSDGRQLPMANLFPLASSRRESHACPEPIEFTVEAENWLLPVAEPHRAYRSDHWKFELMEPTAEVLCGSGEEPDLWRVGNVVGGRLQMHLSAQPSLLRGFFQQATAPHQAVAVG
jgi:cobyrinic acid a,c-diamide synthase